MGWGKETSRKEKRGRVIKKEGGERRGRKGSAMSPSENSFKIHWLQMHQNLFSAGALPQTPLRELVTLGRLPLPYPSCLEVFGVSISSLH